MKLRITSLSVLLACVGGCELLGGDDDHARITPYGVDGVPFGVTQQNAREILGSPQSGGIADGSHRAWWVMQYEVGPHAGLRLYFAETLTDSAGSYPLDFFTIVAPYEGETSRGVGIGSTEADLRRAYGRPLYERVFETNLGEWKRMYFCLGPRDMELLVRNDTVNAIFLGFNEPIPGHPTQCSR